MTGSEECRCEERAHEAALSAENITRDFRMPALRLSHAVIAAEEQVAYPNRLFGLTFSGNPS